MNVQADSSHSPTLTPHLLMIAGGSGITPMFQIIKSSVKDKEDKTKLALIYANVDEDDICTSAPSLPFNA